MIEVLVGIAVGAVIALAGVIAGSRLSGNPAGMKESASPPAAETDEEKEERRRWKEIDEGIQNLMTYSVNGHDGFDVGGL